MKKSIDETRQCIETLKISVEAIGKIQNADLETKKHFNEIHNIEEK